MSNPFEGAYLPITSSSPQAPETPNSARADLRAQAAGSWATGHFEPPSRAIWRAGGVIDYARGLVFRSANLAHRSEFLLPIRAEIDILF